MDVLSNPHRTNSCINKKTNRFITNQISYNTTAGCSHEAGQLGNSPPSSVKNRTNYQRNEEPHKMPFKNVLSSSTALCSVLGLVAFGCSQMGTWAWSVGLGIGSCSCSHDPAIRAKV
jgi:hypothetical protein